MRRQSPTEWPCGRFYGLLRSFEVSIYPERLRKAERPAYGRSGAIPRAARSVQVDVHPGAAEGALVDIFRFACAVPPLFLVLLPLVLPEDVREGGGQLGLQGLVFLFPPGLAVLAYGDGPGRAGAGVQLPENLAAGFGVFAFHPVVFQEEEPGGGLLAWGRGRDGEAGGQDGHSFRAEQEVD